MANTPIIAGFEGIDDLFVDKNGEATLGKLFNYLTTIEDRVSMSLPAYLKRAVVESKVYVTKDAAMEECINDLLFCINGQYAGWVMAALAMNQFVGGTKVRDILETVATEAYNKAPAFKDTSELIAGLNTFRNVEAPNIYSGAKMAINPVIPNDPNDKESDVPMHGAAGSKVVELPKDYRLVSGIIVDVNFAIGQVKGGISVPVAVRLLPTVVSSEVAKQFFATNFHLDTWMRWFKVTTGEIKFWRDFMFEMDKLDERVKAIKKDKTGVLEDMIDRQQNSLSSYVLKILGWRQNRQNIASTVHVFTKYEFDQFCHDTHCNFNNASDRLKYFRKTMAMMVAVIDSEYNTVDMYYAGVGQKARYQFSQLQNFTKPNQYDLTSVMRAFANTQAPRF
jgi:hypothetical protein